MKDGRGGWIMSLKLIDFRSPTCEDEKADVEEANTHAGSASLGGAGEL